MKSKTILDPSSFKPSFKGWIVKGALNPGAIRMKNGDIMLMVRVSESAGEEHDKMNVCPVIADDSYDMRYQKINKKDIALRGISKEVFLKNGMCRLPTMSHLRRVILDKSGYKIKRIDREPFFTGVPGEGEYGVEDPRIVFLDGKYYMTYVGVSIKEGVSTYLASSDDLENWERHGLIFREQNKDAVLFPEKIGGHYVAFHRPEGFFQFSRPNIWISYSPDLVYWGREKTVVQAREGSWDQDRIGAGAPPIRTKKGWLMIYHGVSTVNDVRTYRAGALLFDINNPEKVIARSKGPLFEPENSSEIKGFINNVVFPTGAVLTEDDKELVIYGGGADRVITARNIPLRKIFSHLGV